MFAHDGAHPPVWTQLERVKYLDRARGVLHKWEGLAPYCNDVLERSQALARDGFGPAVLDSSEGFVQYAWIEGRPARARDLTPEVIQRLARYCAYRSRVFASHHDATDGLLGMATCNVRESIGRDLPPEFALDVERAVVVDGRMAPHEWLWTSEGDLLKTDGVDHGDNHLFPGPTDICWDLASAVVEWEMTSPQTAMLVERYERLTGDRTDRRLRSFLIAYLSFRIGESSFAIAGTTDTAERARLMRADARYRRALEATLG